MRGLSWVISLFSTGGKVNPLAIVLLLASSIGATSFYFKYQELVKKLETQNQIQAVVKQAEKRVERIVKADRSKNEAKKAIVNDDLSEWSRIVNGMQRKAD